MALIALQQDGRPGAGSAAQGGLRLDWVAGRLSLGLLRESLDITSISNYYYVMRKQIAFSIPEQEANRLESLLKGRTPYAFALEALREKMSREEGANK